MKDLNLHLSVVFENKEVQDAFEIELVKTLNSITLNGSRKIEGIGQYGNSIVLKLAETNTIFGKMKKESYSLSTSKVGMAVLD